MDKNLPANARDIGSIPSGEIPHSMEQINPMCHNYRALMPQLLKAIYLEPVLHNERKPCNEKPMHHNEE